MVRYRYDYILNVCMVGERLEYLNKYDKELENVVNQYREENPESNLRWRSFFGKFR